MRVLWTAVLPLWLWGEGYGLQTIVEHAKKSNPMIVSAEHQSSAKAMEREAAKSAFWPTLDIGASYARNNPNALVTPGEVTSGYVSASLELYDGGRKSALLDAKAFAYKASVFQKEAFEKSVTLRLIDSFYSVYKLKAMLGALRSQSKELLEQLERMRRFNTAGLATREDIDKLVAVYENNRYLEESMKLNLETAMEQLRLQSGMEIATLSYSSIQEPKNIRFEPYEKQKILQANADALEQSARAAGAGYLPQLTLQHTYNRTDYDKLYEAGGFDTGAMLLDHQNKTTVSLNMRIFDHGKMSKEREALQYQKLALDAEKEYAEREQRMQFRLSEKNLQTNRAKLKSARSELKAAESTYRAVLTKFENGLVDNIAYLDALNKQTLAKARYDETRYDYEIAKSVYYYYAGRDPGEYIR